MSQYVNWMRAIAIEEQKMFPFPDDVQDVSVHQSVHLCACGRASVCNLSHESLFPSSEQRGLIRLPSAVRDSWTATDILLNGFCKLKDTQICLQHRVLHL